MSASTPIWGIVPAAGQGLRFDAERCSKESRPKQYQPLCEQTVIEHSIRALLDLPHLRLIVVALHAEDEYWRHLPIASDSRLRAVKGGKTRAESVSLALESLAADAADDDWALIHDAVRPCVRPADIERLLVSLADHPVGGILATPVRDSIKEVVDETIALQRSNRARLWLAQTPQLFRYGVLRSALRQASRESSVGDEAEAIQLAGKEAKIVEGSVDNLKITYAQDYLVATGILRGRGMAFRVGQGFDSHRTGPGQYVMLGGERISCSFGLVAHSDGDVLLHALCDALLGGAACGDIGRHFPDSEPQYADVSSRDLLHKTRSIIEAKGYRVVNVDLTLFAEEPKLAPHANAICLNIAADLGLSELAVNIKAKTAEGLGWIGRGEGLAASAIVLLEEVF